MIDNDNSEQKRKHCPRLAQNFKIYNPYLSSSKEDGIRFYAIVHHPIHSSILQLFQHIHWLHIYIKYVQVIRFVNWNSQKTQPYSDGDIGQQVQAGANVALYEINQNNLLPNHTLQALIRDTNDSESVAVRQVISILIPFYFLSNTSTPATI